mmetsp:Transcript_11500/g.29046  ORF Transcript_11500/g.29046 Transcript_11500/m.29046 type:complete len:654 (-) Transcript_11500:399-2360(-)
MTGSSLGNGDELPFSWAYLGMCVFVGFLSAASLPLGSVLGLQWQPNSLVTGVMEAFGGGALLAALSVTMVAPISLGAADHSLPADERQTYRVQLAVLVLSAMLGGTCFILLDQLITRKGGELRKWYGQARYYGVQRGTKATVEAKKFRTLQSSSLFGVLSAPRQLELVRMLKPLVFHENDVLYCKGECSDRLMFIRKGTVELQNEPGQPFWIAGAGDVLGSTGILTNGPQPQTAIAVSDVECLFVPRAWVLSTMEEEPQLRYLLLKSSYAKMCVAMEMDRKLFDMRMEAREKMCGRFYEHIKETKSALQEAGASIKRLSLKFSPVNMMVSGDQSVDMDAIQMRELARPEPSLVSSIHDGGRRKSLLDDVELDDIVDWVKEGDLVPVDPEDVIEQQVNSILTGRRDSPPKPCTDAGMSHNTRLAQTMMEPTSMLFNSQAGSAIASSSSSGELSGISGAGQRFKLKKALSAVSMAGIDTDALTAPVETSWRASGATAGTAPLAVFMGILLDGIPESVVIGFHTQERIRELLTHTADFSLKDIIPYTLILGLFLSNFPEALASSMHMYKYGWRKLRIISMWSSIMIMTGIGAGVGFALSNVLSDGVLVGVQGFAAGAMLTMIASSMIPEAVHLCGPNWTGISVLLGFAVTNLFQLL